MRQFFFFFLFIYFFFHQRPIFVFQGLKQRAAARRCACVRAIEGNGLGRQIVITEPVDRRRANAKIKLCLPD